MTDGDSFTGYVRNTTWHARRLKTIGARWGVAEGAIHMVSCWKYIDMEWKRLRRWATQRASDIKWKRHLWQSCEVEGGACDEDSESSQSIAKKITSRKFLRMKWARFLWGGVEDMREQNKINSQHEECRKEQWLEQSLLVTTLKWVEEENSNLWRVRQND